MVDDGLKC